jgi:phosphatidylglycerophosphate synthase
MSRSVTKIDPSPLTPLARALAAWIIPRTPAWVTPNQITVLGLLVNMVGGAAFYLASFQRELLFVSMLMLVLNWVADNLDGELARARRMTSERGFYLDIVLDQFGVMLVCLGIVFSSYAHDFALLMLYLLTYPLMTFMTMMHIIMRGRFPLGRLSPAEGRVGLIVLALLTYVWPQPIVTILGHTLGWFELGMSLTIPLAIIERVVDAVRLYQELAPPQQS